MSAIRREGSPMGKGGGKIVVTDLTRGRPNKENVIFHPAKVCVSDKAGTDGHYEVLIGGERVIKVSRSDAKLLRKAGAGVLTAAE